METTMDERDLSQFGAWDFLIFAVMLVLSMAIGLYFAYVDRKDGSTANYMFGNRRMPAFAVAVSMTVTYMSAMSIISVPAEIYLYGNAMLWGIVGNFLGIMFTSHYFIPFYCKLQVNSVYELLEARFNRNLRIFSSLFINLQYLLYLGVAVYSPSLALSAVTPISLEWSIVMTSLICTIYTTLGGMKAVIWTDFLQGLIMFFGSLAVMIKLTIMKGGLGEVWAANERGGRNNLLSMDVDPRVHLSMPIVIIGFFIFSLQSSATSQPMVQRYISCRDVKQSQRSIYWKGVAAAVIFAVIMLNGMAMYAYYEGCDPVKTKEIFKTDQALPLLVVKIFKDLPGFAGLFVAAAYSATLSTVSSGVNSVATLILHDGVLVFWPNTSKATRMRISKLASVLIGVVIFVVAIMAKYTKGTILQLAFVLYGMIIGPSLAAFLYLFMPFVNTKSAVTSIVGGLGFGIWLAIGMITYGYPDPSIDKMLSQTTDLCDNYTQAVIAEFSKSNNMTTIAPERPVLADTLYAISPFMIGSCSTIVTLTIGIVTSIFTGGNKNINPEFFIPLVSDKRLPASVVKFFRFGVPEIGDKTEDLSVVDSSESDEKLKDENEMEILDNRKDSEMKNLLNGKEY